jgi:hypothetical protein
LHQPFAEYFLAMSLLDKIDNDDDDKDLELVLRENGYFLVRRFLNDLMQNRKTHTKKKSKQRFWQRNRKLL